MPRTNLILFREEDGSVPLRDWLASLNPKARAKCIVRLERLAALGHEIRRPEGDFLRDGIYELRVGLEGVHYRMLYFFQGRQAVVVSHGLTKRAEIPAREIGRAIRNKQRFERAPDRHTAILEVDQI